MRNLETEVSLAPLFYKLDKYENLFVEMNSMELYRIIEGEMIPIDNEAVIKITNNIT